MLYDSDSSLNYTYDSELVKIEAWGPNAFRIRATKCSVLPREDWALSDRPAESSVEIQHQAGSSQITNGLITASISSRGKIVITNERQQVILEEFARHRDDPTDPKASALMIEAREFCPILGGDYHLTYRLESLDRNEKIFGMGQYQQPYLDLKGADLELAQRNSQASIPFMLSSRGYGLLWNNPAIGRAVFGKNVMSFEARSTKVLDYWIVVGSQPIDIVHAYADVTGKPPVIPDYCLGFWQSKLRYTSQQELLEVARGYKEHNLPIDVIVADAWHWPEMGAWRFDPKYWPDPEAMVKELKSMKIELLVSHWPHVGKTSERYQYMLEHGMLVRQDRGLRTSMSFDGENVYPDYTNPATRAFVWKHMKQNYYDKGVRLFWLDEAEPEYDAYDFDIHRYWLGPDLSVGNYYPVEYARAFYEGMKNEGDDKICNLIRCAWAGSQKYGTLLWSGDIASSWGAFRCQVVAGLNVAVAGMPWWTTDIGGFHGGNASDSAFRELCTRWFQYGCFCPVFRMHGDREPRPKPPPGSTTTASGGPNEPWSYGPRCFAIMSKYLHLREQLRPYIRDCMHQAHTRGTPVLRPIWLEFPNDPRCWEPDVCETQYMFGGKYLVAPVLQPGATTRPIYLPQGSEWIPFHDGAVDEEHRRTKLSGSLVVDCPLEMMPVFERVN